MSTSTISKAEEHARMRDLDETFEEKYVTLNYLFFLCATVVFRNKQSYLKRRTLFKHLIRNRDKSLTTFIYNNN